MDRYDRFRQVRDMPIYYFNKASDLRAAAGAVWIAMQDVEPDPRLGMGKGFSMAVACPRVYRMLCGLAIELCIKAIIVARGDQPKITHQLPDLARQAGMSFDGGTNKILGVLSDAIVWTGRYPVPTGGDRKGRAAWEAAGAAELQALTTPVQDGKMQIRGPNGALDWVAFSVLWDTVSDEYRRHHHDGAARMPEP